MGIVFISLRIQERIVITDFFPEIIPASIIRSNDYTIIKRKKAKK